MATVHLIITGRKSSIVIRDPETKKLKLADDTSPQVVQYRDLRHALTDAPKLKGVSQQNPHAAVELRSVTLGEEHEGAKMSLVDWINYAKDAPLPPLTQRIETQVLPHGFGEVDALLAAGEVSA